MSVKLPGLTPRRGRFWTVGAGTDVRVLGYRQRSQLSTDSVLWGGVQRHERAEPAAFLPAAQAQSPPFVMVSVPPGPVKVARQPSAAGPFESYVRV